MISTLSSVNYSSGDIFLSLATAAIAAMALFILCSPGRLTLERTSSGISKG